MPRQKKETKDKAPRRANGEGSIWYYEARDIWRGSVTVGYYANGRPKRKTVQGKSAPEVKRLIKALIAQVDQGYTDPGSTTVAQWLERYYKIFCEPRIRPATKVTYTMFATWWNTYFGKVKLSKLQTSHIQQAVNELAKDKTIGSIQGARTFLNAALNQAIREEMIRKNPLDGVRLAGIKTDKVRAVTEEEIAKLAVSWDINRYGIVIPFMLETGMRIGELLALTWADVDDKEIRITKTQSERTLDGKTGCHVDEPKTEASKRVIPVGLVVPKLVKILKQRRNEEKLFAGTLWSENERLISTRFGYPADRKLINRAIADVCKAAGVERLTSHQLRHTYATRLITSGANPRIAQALLGHENINTTMKIYAEAETKAKEETIRRLSEMTAKTALSESVASALHTLEKA